LAKFRNPTQLGRFARRPAKSIPMAMLRQFRPFDEVQQLG
jgi:hypothetical protein